MMKESVVLLLIVFGASVSSSEDYNVWSVDENALYPSLPIAAPWSEDEQCRRDSRMLIANLKNKTLWAMQMWDSSVKTEFALLYGNILPMGNYDECMQVREPIESKMCGVFVEASVNVADDGDPYALDPAPSVTVWKKFQDSSIDPLKFSRGNMSYGLCVPASCPKVDIIKSIEHRLQQVNANTKNVKYSVHWPAEWPCFGHNENRPYSVGAILFWVVSVILILTTLISTVLDRGACDTDLKIKKLFMSFSLKRNLLFLAKNEEGADRRLNILYGLKMISMWALLIAHRAITLVSMPSYNNQDFEILVRSPLNIAIQVDLIVDTFFFLSGLLACFLMLDVFKKHSVSPWFAIFIRWARLIPLYYFMVWFHADALRELGSGPVWVIGLEKEAKYCQKNWWTNLLMINNYFKTDEACMVHSWFMSCEFQLFVIAVFLTNFINKWEKLGRSLLFFLTLVSIIIPGAITYMYHLNPVPTFHKGFFVNARLTTMWTHLYIPTHARATAYFIGMIAGYIVFKTRSYTKKISLYWTIAGLLAVIGLLAAPMVYSGMMYFKPGKPYNAIESAIFASFRRTLWALGCFVLVMVNCFGLTTYLRYFLQARWIMILSKLTYAMYLVHFYLQLADRARVRMPGHFGVNDAFVLGISDIVVVTLISFLLCLCVEVPFKNLLREILTPIKRGKVVKVEGEPEQLDIMSSGQIKVASVKTQENGL